MYWETVRGGLELLEDLDFWDKVIGRCIAVGRRMGLDFLDISKPKKFYPYVRYYVYYRDYENNDVKRAVAVEVFDTGKGYYEIRVATAEGLIEQLKREW